MTVMSSSLLKLLEWGRGSNPLAKVDVGSSNLLSRSKDDDKLAARRFFFRSLSHTLWPRIGGTCTPQGKA